MPPLTNDQIVALVRELGAREDIAEKLRRASRRSNIATSASLLGGALALILIPLTLLASPQMGGYWLLASTGLLALCVPSVSLLLETAMPSPEGYTSLEDLKCAQDALDLVSKSEGARLIRNTVLDEGRELVGRDYWLMRRVFAQEEEAKTAEARAGEQKILSAKLHIHD